LSTIPVESCLAGVVDLPNTCVIVSIPKEAFNIDIGLDTLTGETSVADRGEVTKPS
jgi:formamidase